MAINSISAATSTQWQLISTSTPTSGTTVSFTGIAGYKTLMFVVQNVTTAASFLPFTVYLTLIILQNKPSA